uniref:Thioredoxin-interacting protein n=1 Tax=Oryzias sinensis TaxID=183150 RepID=A0A8C8DHR3_9TELE
MVLTPSNKPRLFRLVLSNPLRPFYSSGDKVSGLVQLEAAAPCRLARLRVTAAGCARVDRRGGKNRRRVQEVEYLRCEEDLRLEEELSAGEPRLVSSYRGKFGSVRYHIRAELQRPNQHALHCEQEFEVQEPVDVNQSHLLSPAAASTQKKVTCMFIPDGQVSIRAQIDRTGYCEGEDIQIHASFENSCSRIVVPKAAIVCKHSYAANGCTKEWRQKLSAVRGNPIISGMCDMWQGRSISVPKLQPTLHGCDIIKVDYALVVSLRKRRGPERFPLSDPRTGDTGADMKASDLKASDLKASDPKASDLKVADPKASDPKASDLKVADLKASDLKVADPKASDLKASDLKADDMKASDPKVADLKASDMKVADPKADDRNRDGYR